MAGPEIMIALDTNVLIYAHRAGTEQHDEAIRIIEEAIDRPNKWGIAVQCIAEFWGVVTHPSCRGGASSPAEASAFLENLLVDGRGILWHPTPGFGARLLKRAVEMKVSGPRIFDLQIAMTAHENGAREVWTHDASFIRIPGLEIIDPFI